MRVSGAPVDLGRAQGERHAAAIRACLGELRAGHTPSSWRAARRRAARGTGRALARFLPQQCERLEGIGAGAGVGPRELHLLESAWSGRGAGYGREGVIGLSLHLPAALGELLQLRRSVPDAGGFASVEWTAACWAGALGGVNSEGIAVLCESDRPRGEPSLRFLVQDLLLRAADLEAGIEHLRRRARYAGGTGSLLTTAPRSPAFRLQLCEGALEVERLSGVAPPESLPLLLDAAARELVWTDVAGPRQRARAPRTPPASPGPL